MPGGSGMFPALNLFPLNDSFVPKHIVLAGGQRVKIGRQTNAKTVPGEKNGYFDSKVLSRQHAEVWEEGSKIFIKDVKSSNGTFINGARLSQEGVESPPFELNTDDIVEFGIDIVGEDNQTIIHHKVAAKVQCLLSQEDVNAAQQHAVYAQQAQQHGLAHSQQNHLQQAPPGQRRPSLHGAQNHQASLGALAPVGRVPNKNGLSFDLILTRLQNEVQRSRETSAELHSLTAAMSDIHDSLGGVSQAQPVPAYPHILPPVRHDSDPGAQPLPPPQETAVINTLQEQIHQTQSLLSTHVEKIHSLGLESIVGEHDGIKREIGMLREMIDQRKHEMEHEAASQMRKHAAEDDDDDARSVGTVVQHHQFGDEELDEENDEERRQRREELGRPRTPEPSMGLDNDSDGEGDIGVRGIAMRGHRGTIRRGWDASMSDPNQAESEHQHASRETVERLTDRLEQLAAQFESTLELSRELQAKQHAAQEQIASLQAKVEELESLKEVVQQQPSPAPVEPSPEIPPSVIANIMELNKNLEGRWERQREEWDDERERLKAAKEEWERRVRRVEEDLTGIREVASSASTSAAHASSVAALNAKEIAALVAEFRDEAPVTGDSEFAPPSPRSIASDVLRKRKRSQRQRSRSSSRSPPRASPNGHAINEDEGVQPYSPTSLNSAPYTGNGQPIDSQGYNNDVKRLSGAMKGLESPSRHDSMSTSSVLSSVSGRKPDIPIPYMSAAATLGVALLGVAAWTAATHIHT